MRGRVRTVELEVGLSRRDQRHPARQVRGRLGLSGTEGLLC